MPGIIDFYDPTKPDLWKQAGDTLADRLRMQPPFQNGLLHLVYYLLYTLPGREYMHAWVPGVGGKSEADVRAELSRRFSTEFGVTDAAQEAMIGAHIAGFAWIAANASGNTQERNKQEAVYKQNLAAVSWFLWEQGAGELFPLGW
jgi:hypothetical protein